MRAAHGIVCSRRRRERRSPKPRSDGRRCSRAQGRAGPAARDVGHGSRCTFRRVRASDGPSARRRDSSRTPSRRILARRAASGTRRTGCGPAPWSRPARARLHGTIDTEPSLCVRSRAAGGSPRTLRDRPRTGRYRGSWARVVRGIRCTSRAPRTPRRVGARDTWCTPRSRSCRSRRASRRCRRGTRRTRPAAEFGLHAARGTTRTRWCRAP